MQVHLKTNLLKGRIGAARTEDRTGDAEVTVGLPM